MNKSSENSSIETLQRQMIELQDQLQGAEQYIELLQKGNVQNKLSVFKSPIDPESINVLKSLSYFTLEVFNDHLRLWIPISLSDSTYHTVILSQEGVVNAEIEIDLIKNKEIIDKKLILEAIIKICAYKLYKLGEQLNEHTTWAFDCALLFIDALNLRGWLKLQQLEQALHIVDAEENPKISEVVMDRTFNFSVQNDEDDLPF